MGDDMNINLNNQSSYNSSNTFNLVIGVATLLIALLGATFAYFSASARSDENAVTVQSAYVSIHYDGGTEIKATELIPSTERIALNRYKRTDVEIKPYDPETDGELIEDYDEYNSDYLDRRCVDSKGKEVCYVYQFSIRSDGAIDGKTNINAYVQVNENQFENLSYILYEVRLRKEMDKVVTDKYGIGIVDEWNIVSSFDILDNDPENTYAEEMKFAKFEQPEDKKGDDDQYLYTQKPVACLFEYNKPGEGEEEFAIDDPKRCKEYEITNGELHTYQLVIWLNETGSVQDEQNLTFQGTVIIEVSGGVNTNEYEDGKITGAE